MTLTPNSESLREYNTCHAPDSGKFCSGKGTAFDAWFSGSKVTDSAGKPLRVYHGTAHSFDSFGSEEAAKVSKGGSDSRYGFFFTTDPDEADAYTYSQKGGAKGGHILPVYLRITNPRVMARPDSLREIADAAAAAKRNGRDGLIIDWGEGTKHYVVFGPAQIKSATGNRGTWSQRSSRITEANSCHAPAGSPKGGQFCSKGGPDIDVPLSHDAEWSLDGVKRAGNWKLTLDKSTSDAREFIVEPITIPARIRTARVGYKGNRETLYDPELADEVPDAQVGGNMVKAKPGSVLFLDDMPGIARNDGHLYRGMSYAEWLHVQATGEIKSEGSHNLGDEQVGLTYFSADPAQAGSYASGFAPWQYTPSFERPAIVVRVKDPGTSRHVKGTGEDERGIPGAIKVSDIVDVFEGHPYAMSRGMFQLYRNRLGKYAEGSRGGSSAHVVWRKSARRL